MKDKNVLLTIFLVLISMNSMAQEKQIVPELTKYNDTTEWVTFNREVHYDNGIYLNGKRGEGLLWLKNIEFSNGRIEIDIKGQDIPGESFVGVAFHGLNDSTYDAVYFRAFNFKNPERNGHSVQYISHPVYTWYKLRYEFPEMYENSINPVPEPNDWFHVTVVLKNPFVEVFVNNSQKSSLRIEQLSAQKSGWIGLWVGNGSEGFFKNLKIIPD